MARTLIGSENQEQRALVKWLSMHPVLKNFYCKNNNEGQRTVAQGWNLKLMGLRPGVSDILVYYPSKTKHGLFLEVKRNKKYSKSEMETDTWIMQQEFINTVKSVGYEGKTCYGWEDGVRIIQEYLRT